MRFRPANGYTAGMLRYEITEKDHCRQIDSFLRNHLPAAPVGYLRKLLTSGHVKINGIPAAAGTLLRAGDRVTQKESTKTLSYCAAGPLFLDILHEDNWIFAFNKPAGMAMHRTAEDGGVDLVALGGRFLAERDEAGKLRPVNRLDRGTSGVVLMARNAVAAGMFGRLVKEEGLGKIYLALANEGFPGSEGIIDLPLEGKEAETGYRTLFDGNGGALVALYPRTGRMHQIRQHLRYLGHPVWGDRRYGGRSIKGCNGHLLHSFRTTLTHPATGAALDIFAPLPAGFLRLLENLTGESFPAVLSALAELPPGRS